MIRSFSFFVSTIINSALLIINSLYLPPVRHFQHKKVFCLAPLDRLLFLLLLLCGSVKYLLLFPMNHNQQIRIVIAFVYNDPVFGISCGSGTATVFLFLHFCIETFFINCPDLFLQPLSSVRSNGNHKYHIIQMQIHLHDYFVSKSRLDYLYPI